MAKIVYQSFWLFRITERLVEWQFRGAEVDFFILKTLKDSTV